MTPTRPEDSGGPPRNAVPGGRMAPMVADRRAWGVIRAVLLQRCPRCHKGRLFRGLFAMNDPCPVCGLVFQREEGYFLGAMYVTYVLGAVVLGAGYFLARWLLAGWNEFLILNLLCLLYLPLTPALFRYSRTIWIHIDRWASPSDVSAGAFEKERARQFAEQARREAPPDNPAAED